MPSTQIHQRYLLGALPSFLGHITFQNDDGTCFVPSVYDVARIDVTHRRNGGGYTSSLSAVVNGIEDLPVSKTAVTMSLITGDTRTPAFLYTGEQPFDYNFLCVNPYPDVVWFPDIGLYQTTFDVELLNGRHEEFVFDSQVINAPVTVQIGKSFRVVIRSYTKVASMTGVVTADWTKQADLESITADLLNNRLEVLQTVDVPLSN